MPAVKKPLSAYFHFAADHRQQLKDDNPGVGLGPLQRLIAAKWSELTEKEKTVYNERASADKERYAKEMEEYVRSGGGEEEPEALSKGTAFPLARVRKLAKADPEIKNVSKEGVALVARATELFIASLAATAAKIPVAANRKTLSGTDVASAMRRKECFQFLVADFPIAAPRMRSGLAAVRAAAPPAAEEAPEAGAQISNFFSKGGRPQSFINAELQVESGGSEGPSRVASSSGSRSATSKSKSRVSKARARRVIENSEAKSKMDDEQRSRVRAPESSALSSMWSKVQSTGTVPRAVDASVDDTAEPSGTGYRVAPALNEFASGLSRGRRRRAPARGSRAKKARPRLPSLSSLSSDSESDHDDAASGAPGKSSRPKHVSSDSSDSDGDGGKEVAPKKKRVVDSDSDSSAED